MAGIKPNNFPSISGGLTGTEELYTQTGGVNEKFTVDDIKDYVGSLSYSEVGLSSEQILNLNSTPVVLLDSVLSTGQYFLIDKIVLEYTYGTTPYAIGVSPTATFDFYIGGSTLFSKNADILTESNDAYTVIKEYFDYGLMPSNGLGFRLTSNSATDGDGTVKVKTWYTIEDFG